MPNQTSGTGNAQAIGPQGRVAKIEFWLRARGWKRIANLLGRWDERGLRE